MWCSRRDFQRRTKVDSIALAGRTRMVESHLVTAFARSAVVAFAVCIAPGVFATSVHAEQVELAQILETWNDTAVAGVSCEYGVLESLRGQLPAEAIATLQVPQKIDSGRGGNIRLLWRRDGGLRVTNLQIIDDASEVDGVSISVGMFAPSGKGNPDYLVIKGRGGRSLSRGEVPSFLYWLQPEETDLASGIREKSSQKCDTIDYEGKTGVSVDFEELGKRVVFVKEFAWRPVLIERLHGKEITSVEEFEYEGRSVRKTPILNSSTKIETLSSGNIGTRSIVVHSVLWEVPERTAFLIKDIPDRSMVVDETKPFGKQHVLHWSDEVSGPVAVQELVERNKSGSSWESLAISASERAKARRRWRIGTLCIELLSKFVF